jgi:hypothetical protein
MADLSTFQMGLIAFGGLIMFCVVLRAIGQSAGALAWMAIEERREAEAKKRAEDAAAEAVGRAAALEPLALNADGSIEEPVLAMVETPA